MIQLSVLLGLFVALKAVAYWLDRYALVFSDRGDLFTGASYTDVNALLPAKTILVFAAVVCAIAFFANVVVRNFRLPAAALVLLLLSSLVIGVAYPAIVQQFVVRPSADQREATSSPAAIESTRNAYDLSTSSTSTTPSRRPGEEVDPAAALAELRNDTETIPNARLLDPNVLSDTFTARQQIRNVYGFPEKLDIDRYTIGGDTQDYVVAVRELNSQGLSENQDTWINRHTVYTHGNGFVAAPANEVVAGQEGGEPDFTTEGPADTRRHRGQRGRRADLLRRADAGLLRRRCARGGEPREFDLPEGSDGEARSTTPTTARAASRWAASSAADLRDLLPGAELPALRRRQRGLQGALRPRPDGPGGEGRAVPHRGRRPLPRGRRRPGGLDARRLHHVGFLPLLRADGAGGGGC
jgi:hypothetical protein